MVEAFGKLEATMARFRALCALVICFASVDALAWPYYNQFFVSNSRQIHLSNGRQEHVISGIYGEWYNFTFYAESHFTILDLVFQDQSGHDS